MLREQALLGSPIGRQLISTVVGTTAMCVFRATGSAFEVEKFLQTSALQPCVVFKAGEPRSPSRPDGPVHSRSGFHVGVSDADWTDVPRQVADAIQFLDRHAQDLRALALPTTVEDMRLDFPIELRIGRDQVVVQFDYFPPQLVKAAGDLGIGIEVSIYPPADTEGERASDRPA